MLAPCRYCWHKEGCELRERWREKLRGLRLTYVRFRCEKRLSEHQPGRRVLVRFFEGSALDYNRPEECEFPGTVMGAEVGKGAVARLRVHFDEPDDVGWFENDPHGGEWHEVIKNRAGVMLVRPSQCKPLDEIVPVCPECGWPTGCEHTPDRHPWSCNTCNPWKYELCVKCHKGGWVSESTGACERCTP